MRRHLHSQRGAGTVELALGSMLFVTVLLFGIHFAEVGFLSLKIQEAQAFAVWESTGRRAHRFRFGDVTGNTREIHQPVRDIHITAGERAQARYADYDGRSRIEGSGNVTQAATAGSRIRVRCAAESDLAFELPRAPGPARYDTYRDQLQTARGFYRSRPGVRCRAQAQLRMFNVPQGFQDSGDGFFKVEHARTEPFRVCGAGRARDGECRGEFGVLLGDWGLEGPVSGGLAELNRDVRLNGGPSQVNRPYRAMVEELWKAGKKSHGDAGSRFAGMIGQESMSRSPHDESEFYMSYRGGERDYLDGRTINGRRHHWNTSGMYFSDSRVGRIRREESRADCWLGLKGCQ